MSDAPMEAPSYELDESSFSAFSDSAGMGGEALDALGTGLEAGAAEGVAGAVDATVVAAAEVGAETAGAAAAVCPPLGVVAGVIAAALAAVSTAITIWQALTTNEVITLDVANNTPWQLNYAQDQVYINHGKVVAFPASLAPAIPSQITAGSFVLSNDKGALLGPSGVVWFNVVDPEDGALIAILYIAYSDPYSDSPNSCAVGFNVANVGQWFDGFNNGAPQSSSTATTMPPAYSTLYASASIEPTGRLIKMNVEISSLEPVVAAATSPAATVASSQQQICAYFDRAGNIWGISDINGMWSPRLITTASSGDPENIEVKAFSVIAYDGGIHYIYSQNFVIYDFVPGASGPVRPPFLCDTSGCAVNLNGGNLNIVWRQMPAPHNVFLSFTNGDGTYTNQQLAGDASMPGFTPATSGPVAACDVVTGALGTQAHFFYFDNSGNLWDLVFNSSWTAYQLTGDGGLTSAPAGTGTPATSPFSGGGELHVGYCDKSGDIWDLYTSDGTTWSVWQVTGTSGKIVGPAVAGNPTLLSVDGAQLYFAYFDAGGNLQAAVYNANGAGGWSFQTLAGNSGGLTNGPAGQGEIAATYFQGQPFFFYQAQVTNYIWGIWEYQGIWSAGIF